MHYVLLLTLFALLCSVGCGTCPCLPGSSSAESSFDDAVARHDWTWFGKTEADATAAAEKAGVKFRVVMRDGEPQPTTRDMRPGRINATVQDGHVMHIAVEGEATMEGAPEADMVFVLGRSEKDALAAAEKAGRRCRVVDRGDGKSMALTMDHDPQRLNLTLKEDVVVAVKGG